MPLSDRKKSKVFFYLAAILLATLEFSLRFFFGFTDAVLIQESPDYEYIAQPNQSRQRFGNHIAYNQQSMRSGSPEKDAKTILGFGDSVLNGGSQTDQSELATSLLSEELDALHGYNIQFLNISAGSWGPDNAFAYLNEFGNFNAKRIYLVVSSHDAYDIMDFRKIVGIEPGFQNEQYSLAIVELFDRYLSPRILSKNEKKINPPEDFNPGFEDFFSYAKANSIPLIIILHAEQEELKIGNYNAGGQEIIAFAEANNIPLLKDMDYGIDTSHFRDNIHINAKGQRLLANMILKYESSLLSP